MKKINPFVLDFVKQGVLKTPAVIEAFKKIDRTDFVLPEFKEKAYVNEPLPIGFGQTISQPYTVAFMLELLQPEPGNKIFEIGFGSGWQTALLAYCSQNLGKIYAVERIPELFKFGRKNIAKYSFIKKGIVKTIGGNATMGLKRHAPFDRIIAAASARDIPKEWLKELKIGGRLVVPVKNSIWLYIKKLVTVKGVRREKFEKKEYRGYSFVPLILKK